ncbi:MAG: hypothetical protein ABIX01_03800 [Chitinophagaceae bacterium]
MKLKKLFATARTTLVAAYDPVKDSLTILKHNDGNASSFCRRIAGIRPLGPVHRMGACYGYRYRWI